MVLGICRRVLHHLQDAEDAFQATFILLARRCADIRKQESLASWLHGVAYRMALNARRSASRRRKYEGRVPPAPPFDRTAELEWREVQAFLDDEIQRLPEIYRTPFILFYLENRKQADIARQLEIKESTVWRRLAHARRLLQERLSRRGVTLPAVLCLVGVSAGAATAAVPGSLVSSVVQASTLSATGSAFADVASAEVMALLEEGHQAMTLSKFKLAKFLLLAVGVLGTGFGLALNQYPSVRGTEMVREQSLQSQRASQPAAADSRVPHKKENDVARETKAKEVVEVRGRVLDPDGRPVAGAKLYLGSREKEPRHPLRATGDSDGRFTFRYPRSGSPGNYSAAQAPPLKVLAVAQGYGCAWESVGSADKELTLRLVKDAAVGGRIVDADGRPVANAKLAVDGVAAFTGAKKSGIVFVHTLPYTDYPWDAANGWLGPLPAQGIVLMTSADGRFSLTGVGPNRIVSLHLEAPGIATTDLGVVSGAPVQHVAVQSRPIRGVVRDKISGQPLAGATVSVALATGWWANAFDEDPDEKLRWGKTITDKDGRYELLGLAKPLNFKVLEVKPAQGQLYFRREVELGDTPGLAALVADIDMVQGVTVRGNVTDKATHKPIAGARVVYYALWGNPFVSREALYSGAITEPDGSYVLTVHTGPGVIGVICRNPDAYMPALVTAKEQNDFFRVPLPDRGSDRLLTTSVGTGKHPLMQADYNALVLLEPKEGDKALVKDIALERALERKGRIVGPDGHPIPGVTVSGLSPGVRGISETLEGAEFTVRGINPRAKRLLTFQHKEKNLGYCLKELPDEKLGPLTIKLQPCGSISGRIVDADGMPVVASRRVFVGPAALEWLTLDKEGRFHVKGLLPGLEYSVNDDKRAFILRDAVVVESGKNKDLGDIQVSDN
jgi:RNA polymerase sigma factor (sigma-70 family)